MSDQIPECPTCHRVNSSGANYCSQCATPISRADDLTADDMTMAEEAVNELTPGSTFAGRYLIIEELGCGGMGRVYKAIDRIVNEKVALKLVRAGVSSQATIIQRFANELKVTRHIIHKNVGRMYDINQEAGTHYITMEFVSGQDLTGLLRQAGQLTIESTISIARQACLGLAEAHRLGVVHRDLKPSNIMIDAGGNVRIIDFGIARSPEATDIMLEGRLIGTPNYMSPEQAQGGEVDHLSDIYSLGTILFEMLTGRLPFKGKTPSDVVRMHISELPPDPREINPLIPEDPGQGRSELHGEGEK